jgi:hypothetical protein
MFYICMVMLKIHSTVRMRRAFDLLKNKGLDMTTSVLIVDRLLLQSIKGEKYVIDIILPYHSQAIRQCSNN